jgi:hypothetical protein
VTIVRQRRDDISILVLGDNLVVLPDMQICDDRLSNIAPDIRAAYRARLASGAGYGPDHQDLLAELQQQQALHRNSDGGYWIAEADPAAAWHAITAQLDAATTAVLATDGAYKTMTHLGANDWHSIASSRANLAAILDQSQEWEELHDPGGRILPRAKRHDDKSLAAIRFAADLRS